MKKLVCCGLSALLSATMFGCSSSSGGSDGDKVELTFWGPVSYTHLQPVPEDMTDIVAEYKNQIAEAIAMSDDEPVSYTHLDVYKRQLQSFIKPCLYGT